MKTETLNQIITSAKKVRLHAELSIVNNFINFQLGCGYKTTKVQKVMDIMTSLGFNYGTDYAICAECISYASPEEIKVITIGRGIKKVLEENKK